MSGLCLHGFTLIELLVVITIILVLLALLLPAVQAAREVSRRSTCMNNERQLSRAMLAFESGRRYFPGYRNTIGKTDSVSKLGNTTSWVVPLLPYLERKDLYDVWATTTVTSDSADANKLLKILMCPSDPQNLADAADPWLSYVCNAGKNDGTNVSNVAAEGVCLDQKQTVDANWNVLPVPPANKVGLEFITSHDGASNTLLLAESRFDALSRGNNKTLSKWISTEANQVGFNWNGTINKVTDKIISRHNDGAIVSFCDGHQAFLREDVDVLGTKDSSGNTLKSGVFQHLMTPWGGGTVPPLSGFLDEAAF